MTLTTAPGHAATPDLEVPLPGRGGVVLAKLLLPVKATTGTRLSPQIALGLRVRGALPASASVLAAAPRLRRLSRTRGVLEAYVAVVNTRGNALARAVAPRVLPSFVIITGSERAVKPQKGLGRVEVSISLRSGEGRPLASAAREKACTTDRAPHRSLETLAGARALGAISPREAWTAAWKVGCGDAAAGDLLRYIALTGRGAPCTALAGFDAAPLNATENRLDIRCPKLDVSSVSVLDPGSLGPYTRWSEWAVVDVGLTATGACGASAATPWGVGLRCDLPRPMARGGDLVVDFGPPLPAETRLVIRVIDSDNTEWFAIATVSVAPLPVLGNALGLRQAVLSSTQIELRPLAGFDIVDGRVDSRVLVSLLVLAQRLRLGGVGPFVSGHPYFIAGTNLPSNHAFGRAVDIAFVGGTPVSAASIAAREAVLALVALPAPLRPDEIGCPFADLDALPGVFTNADHQDHLHIGFDF